ncbi:hypothetical protein [Microbacterium lacus]|uniref:hypothetical protein n=1 Tax=Microbacterium lacus TaxID=415217 RepID=UPI000C2B6F11|nr:hypothetical protein [Microbacterium lacus]
MTNTEDWLAVVTRGQSARQIATRASIPTATFARQLASDSVSAENAVAIAVAYDASPLQALVAIGLLTEKQASLPTIRELLTSATDKELVDEVMDRLGKASGEDTAFDRPVVPIRPNVGAHTDDELEEVAFDAEVDHSEDTGDYHS